MRCNYSRDLAGDLKYRLLDSIILEAKFTVTAAWPAALFLCSRSNVSDSLDATPGGVSLGFALA